jgi:hypothetical protein
MAEVPVLDAQKHALPLMADLVIPQVSSGNLPLHGRGRQAAGRAGNAKFNPTLVGLTDATLSRLTGC